MSKKRYECDIELNNGKFIIVGGLTSDFLKANGDKDNSYYLKTAYNNKFIYASGAQTFTIPENTQVLMVLLNKAPLYITDEYTVSGITLTITAANTLVASDEIYVTGLI